MRAVQTSQIDSYPKPSNTPRIPLCLTTCNNTPSIVCRRGRCASVDPVAPSRSFSLLWSRTLARRAGKSRVSETRREKAPCIIGCISTSTHIERHQQLRTMIWVRTNQKACTAPSGRPTFWTRTHRFVGSYLLRQYHVQGSETALNRKINSSLFF